VRIRELPKPLPEAASGEKPQQARPETLFGLKRRTEES